MSALRWATKSLLFRVLKWDQIGEKVKEIITGSLCPQCGAIVGHLHSTLPIQLVAHQAQHSPFVSSPLLRTVWRCVAFLSEYHSCTCFLSKMGDERTNYCGIILGCCTDSQIFRPDILKTQANFKLYVTDINKMVNPCWLLYLNWTVLPFLRPRPLSSADKSHLGLAADGIAIHPSNE